MKLEIKIKAVKQKSNYAITDSTLGSTKKECKERFFPLFELMMKEINNDKIKNVEGGNNG